MHENLPLQELRDQWALAWGRQPHARIGRTMLEKSLAYKVSDKHLTLEQQARLNQLIKQYKRNPTSFDGSSGPLKPGTRLVRIYNGKKHSVLVKTNGFEYAGHTYKSLSRIANDITGKRWNGWVFFGLKKVSAS
jgi:hypothetical protein